jgi:hypothetical protein
MSDVIQTVIVLVLAVFAERFLRSYPMRKWLGVLLVVLGSIGCTALSQVHVLGFDIGLISALAVPVGVMFFLNRRRFVEIG